MSSPFYQPVSAASPPDPVTPAGAPSDPAGYAGVTPHGRGPAPYDIQAAMPEVQAQFDAANAVAGAGVLYPMGPRQRETGVLLSSPQGFGAPGGYDINSGFAGEPHEPWPADVDPGGNAATPDQGTGDFTGTGTD